MTCLDVFPTAQGDKVSVSLNAKDHKPCRKIYTLVSYSSKLTAQSLRLSPSLKPRVALVNHYTRSSPSPQTHDKVLLPSP
jgi:hypothetical protein